jgi:predicted nucleic acid-binding protein
VPSALRVVLDTNVLLPGLAYPGRLPGRIVAAWRHGSVDVVLSTFILDELRRILESSRRGLARASAGLTSGGGMGR